MINDQLDFVTPRPRWATTSEVAGEDVCAHVRDFSVGPVTIEIRQEDRMVDGHTVYGEPRLVLAGEDSGEPATPQLLARLGQQAIAAAEAYARITR